MILPVSSTSILDVYKRQVDIYGALSEYIGLCISNDAVTLLDINNSVPVSYTHLDVYKRQVMKRAIRGYQVRKKILSDPNINEMKN